MRSNRLQVQRAEPDFLSKIKHPKQLIYSQQDNPSSSMSKNLLSIMKARHDFPKAELVPLPFFYVEKRAFLGKSSWDSWRSMVCEHDNLLLNYSDVYPAKRYHKLLYSNEYLSIARSKTLRFEREQLQPEAVFFNKLLLGTTLLPRPIAEALVEAENDKIEAVGAIASLWKSDTCAQCLRFYKTIRKIRIVERYLFLRYQTVTLGIR